MGPVALRPNSVGVFLRADAGAFREWLTSQPRRLVCFCVVAIVIGAGTYGAAMGWWRCPLQALYTGIKLPLVILLTTLGIGVAFSGITVLVYQGLLTLGAGWVKEVLTDATRMKSEIMFGQQVQLSLLPGAVPEIEGYEIGAEYLAALKRLIEESVKHVQQKAKTQ